MGKCFVIMPLTTPPSALEQYRGDTDHFIHVLDHLFSPAVEAAGYELVRPVMKGADLIHAEIIKNLEEAELVLCDFSLLNPNVFFELGIRTALDRPVALVKDDKTPSPPFDTSGINYHSYDSSLAPWPLQAQVETLRQHLEDTASRAEGRNSLWRYFGLTQRAEPADIADPIEGKLDLLLSEVEKLHSSPGGRRVRASQARVKDPARLQELAASDVGRLLDLAAEIAAETGTDLNLIAANEHAVVLEAQGHSLTHDQKQRIFQLGSSSGVTFMVMDGTDAAG